MKALALFATLVLTSHAVAEDTPAPEIDKSVVDSLFADHPTIASFTDAIQFAEQAGVDSQTLVEAQTRYYLFKNTDITSIRKMVGKLDKLVPIFDPKKSQLFKTKEEFASMAEYAKAILAYEAEDPQGLKKHVTEAIWLNPKYADNFASLILGYRAILARRAEQTGN